MSNEKRKPSAVMRYASLATQWMLLMAIGVWSGIALDRKLRIKALFIIIFPLIALGVSLWQLIKSLNKDKDA